MATMVPSAEMETLVPKTSLAASPSMSVPSCVNDTATPPHGVRGIVQRVFVPGRRQLTPTLRNLSVPSKEPRRCLLALLIPLVHD